MAVLHPMTLLEHVQADHVILQAVSLIHQPDPTGRHCIEDAQTWPCATSRAFDFAAVAADWARWRMLPVSHATPTCRYCEEAPRLAQGTCIMRHLPSCQHPAYLA